MNGDTRHRSILFGLILCTALTTIASAEPVETVRKDVAYRPSTQPASPTESTDACVLDIHIPVDSPVVATIVWFHGGGMTGGDKEETAAMAKILAAEGIAMVSANYRLSPAVKYPIYIDDAAAAVAWTFAHATDFGGDPKSIYIGGYSAGGYLAMLLAADPARLKPFGLSPTQLRGVATVSPQTSTHFTILAERGIEKPKETSVIDDDAPIRHASAEMPRVLSFIGDNDWPARAEELAYFFAYLKIKKHPDARLIHIEHRGHGAMWGKATEEGDPVRVELVKFLTAAK